MKKYINLLTFLLQKKIAFIKGKVDNEGLSKTQEERYDRQLTYLSQCMKIQDIKFKKI